MVLEPAIIVRRLLEGTLEDSEGVEDATRSDMEGTAALEEVRRLRTNTANIYERNWTTSSTSGINCSTT